MVLDATAEFAVHQLPSVVAADSLDGPACRDAFIVRQPMKAEKRESAKATPEFQNFERALRQVLSVPKSVVMAEVERQHKPRKRRNAPKGASAVDPAASDSR